MSRQVVPEPWTAQQWEAISERGKNLLVAAAAGSGKTAVLVERVLRLITGESPIPVDRLLVVTFTEAAAAQMRGRIVLALEKAQVAQADDPAPSRQLLLMGRASISTLHSFCLTLLRRHFYHLGLDPAFRVMDEGESALLKQDVLGVVLERAYEAGEPEFTRLVDGFGGDTGTRLEQLVLGIHQHAMSQPLPLQWLAEVARAFQLPEDARVEELPWTYPALEEAQRRLADAALWLAESREWAAGVGGPRAYLAVLDADGESLAGLARACTWDELAEKLRAWPGFGRLPPARKAETSEEARSACQEARDRAKGILGGLRDSVFSRPGRELVEELRGLSPVVGALTGLVTRFHHAYQEAKAQRAQVDFGDLEHFCLRLLGEDDGSSWLQPSAIARDLQAQYDEVLVDEYQDINEVQDTIIRMVSRQDHPEPNLFMVGDVKQSIYRFRLADPGLFLRHYDDFSREMSGRSRRIDLSSNFRSRHSILHGVNSLFRQLMNGGVGEISYELPAELVPGRPDVPGDTGPIEVYLCERDASNEIAGLETGEEPGPDGEEEDLPALEREAHLAAGLIQEMVAGSTPFRFYDVQHQAVRDLTYRDVVILMRATRERANVVTEVFREIGIPIYAELGTGYFAATEVEVALAMLRVTDNPRQDIPLAALLRSPAVGLSPGELTRVRLQGRDGSFYDAVVAAARNPDLGDTATKLGEFLQRLEGWRTAARRGSLSRLVWQVLEETRYYDYCGGMPGGAQRQANLRALYDRARQFDGFARPGLFRFLRFVERLQETQDLGNAPALGQEEDVVRVMSVHKSKGLEFPVVLLLDAGKAFNWRELNEDVLYHRQLGLGPRVVDPEQRIKYPSLAHTAVSCQRRLETLAEEMRILYVAMTRAQEKLVLVGSCRQLERKRRRWAMATCLGGRYLPDAQLARATSWLDWLGPALSRVGALEPGPGVPAPQGVVGDASAWWKVCLLPPVRPWRRQPGGPENLGGLTWEAIRGLQPPQLPADPDLAGEIARRLEWTYPQLALTGKAGKISVSELKRWHDPFREEAEDRSAHAGQPPRRPRFLTDGGPGHLELGVGTHAVIQHLDLEGPLDPEGLTRQLESMVQKELVLPAVAPAISTTALAGFFQSGLGRRLVESSRSVQREVPFTLAVPVEELYGPGGQPGDFVMVQGMVDCVFDSGEGWALLDFKTDRDGENTRWLEDYRRQIRVYRRALETATARPVTEAYLVFLATGAVVPVT